MEDLVNTKNKINRDPNISPISFPLADKKLERRCLKLIRKSKYYIYLLKKVFQDKKSFRGTKIVTKCVKKK